MHCVCVDDGRVVVDHVAAGELLHDIDACAEQDAAEVLDAPAFEQLLVLEGPAGAFEFDGRRDLCLEGDNVGVVEGDVPAFEACDYGRCFVDAAFFDEEARRFREGEHLEYQANCEEGLEGDGKTPLCRAIDERHGEIQPIGNAYCGQVRDIST